MYKNRIREYIVHGTKSPPWEYPESSKMFVYNGRWEGLGLTFQKKTVALLGLEKSWWRQRREKKKKVRRTVTEKNTTQFMIGVSRFLWAGLKNKQTGRHEVVFPNRWRTCHIAANSLWWARACVWERWIARPDI